MLLVDDHQPEVGTGANTAERGPIAIRASPAAQPPPLVLALALRQRGVQDRDRVAEPRLEARRRSAA